MSHTANTATRALLAILLAGATGCSRRQTFVEQCDRDGILLRGNLSEPKDLDPHTVTGVTEFNILSALLEGLVGEDPRDLSPVPAAAESWDISPDRTEYTFHLRKDARWSNGDPVVAGDFVFSFHRILSPALGSPYAYMLFCLRNAEKFHRKELADFASVGVRAPDDHTLVLSLSAPVPYFLPLLTHHSWFPVHPATILKFGAMDQIGTRWTRPGNFVGNGPFALRAWDQGSAVRVVKSPTYWDRAAVRLNEIRFLPIGDHKTEEHSFLAGQLHITGTVPIDRIAFYRENHPQWLRLEPYLGTYYFLLNVTRPPLNNPLVRQALALALDRDLIVSRVTKAGEMPALHFTPPDTAGYTAAARLAPDAQRARDLLARAGYPGGKGFPRLSFLYNTSESHARIAQAVQQMWKNALGIEIELVNMEWKFYLDRTQKQDYDIARAGWISDYVDPNSFLDLWLTGGGNNRTGWSSAEYDALVRGASAEGDPKRRMDMLQQAEAVLMRELPVIPLYFYRSKSLVRPSVRGWYANILDHHPYQHVYLQPDPEGQHDAP